MFRRRAFQIAVLAALTVAGTNTCAAYRIRSVRQAGVHYLLLGDVAGFYGMSVRSAGKDSTLTSRYSTLTFRRHKREAEINGVKVHLSHAVSKWRSEPLISTTDFRLILEPLLRSRTLERRQIKRIMIDPGHGGRDPGAQAGGVDEKNITLAVARRLYRQLCRYGYDVGLTRNSDKEVPLWQRTRIVQQYRADVLISLHVNSASANGARGVETYLLTPEGTPSTYSNSNKGSASPGNTFDTENTRLAYEVQKGILRLCKTEDRGTKHAEFVVLRNVPCAAVLVEMGFLSNTSDRKRIADPRFQEKMAQGISHGIRRYHRAVLE